jgi:hypothetical protein
MVQTCLDELRNGRSVESELNVLETVPKSDFLLALNSDASRKAFWINAYNVFNLVGMKKRQPKSFWDRWFHFSRRDFFIAGICLSLNDIEHGILRRSKFWWAGGWLRNPYPRKVIRALQLEKDDPRIHFALNCGANGCPAIRCYTALGVEEELVLATSGFFELEVAQTSGVIWASAIFKMYLGDFGGIVGLREWIKTYRSDLEIGELPIRFRKYDWSTNLQKFAEITEKGD